MSSKSKALMYIWIENTSLVKWNWENESDWFCKATSKNEQIKHKNEKSGAFLKLKRNK